MQQNVRLAQRSFTRYSNAYPTPPYNKLSPSYLSADKAFLRFSFCSQSIPHACIRLLTCSEHYFRFHFSKSFVVSIYVSPPFDQRKATTTLTRRTFFVRGQILPKQEGGPGSNLAQVGFFYFKIIVLQITLLYLKFEIGLIACWKA